MSTSDPSAEPKSSRSASKASKSTTEGAGETTGETNDAPHALAPMDFATFVMSLGSSAMVNMGQIPAPGSDQTHIDLPAAKQIIDILGILEEKTRGNLDDSEKKLLSSLLYDLRVKYVDAQQTS